MLREKQMERLMVKLGKEFLVIKVVDIEWIKAERNYLRLFLGGRSFLIRNTLSEMEKKLDSKRFIRINKSTIVNIDQIKKIKSDENYNYFVVLNNDVSEVWGRRFRNNLKKILYN